VIHGQQPCSQKNDDTGCYKTGNRFKSAARGEEMVMSTMMEPALQERFEQLKNQWKVQSKYLSNTAQMAMLWSYQQIIGMGAPVLPLILAELLHETDHWFWALEAIAGENPVPAEAAGDVAASADAWLEWGRSKGLLRDNV